MKPQFPFITLCILAFGWNAQSQVPGHGAQDAASLLRDMFEPDSLTNMAITIVPHCPARYINVVSNANLFTPDEQHVLNDIQVKYKDVTTNTGPLGSILIGLENGSNYCLAHFSFTNSGAREDIIFRHSPEQPPRGGGYDELVSPNTAGSYVVARFRSKDNSGYDVIMTRDRREVITFAQIKGNKVNGLVVNFNDDHCGDLLHFSDGRANGKWLMWGGRGANDDDDFLLEISIRAPLDYFKYMTQEVKM